MVSQEEIQLMQARLRALQNELRLRQASRNLNEQEYETKKALIKEKVLGIIPPIVKDIGRKLTGRTARLVARGIGKGTYAVGKKTYDVFLVPRPRQTRLRRLRRREAHT